MIYSLLLLMLSLDSIKIEKASNEDDVIRGAEFILPFKSAV